ncbi:bifunctional adenosylcobinamide kinase/adenosylcobinamide-phosphate guanylyltransferase [Bacillus sp. B190/17]|uniref:Bifunctional adenosylcobinamide kinase/adenosylcobinamide-phosphate guanylyltransferase n=1 Tax=Bacillus lumedeiriae TaxID=3058829 RepID=A0ABW8I9F9_9BACI
MHLITGGAFNGKKQWVKKEYKLEVVPYRWYSFYQTGEPIEWTDPIIVLEGIERHVRRLVEKEGSSEAARVAWNKEVAGWLEWEKEKQDRQLILIGTDMTKGVVPANPFDRMWRDAAGWCFQDTAYQAQRVIQVWYGLPQIIKNEEEGK